MSPHWLFFPAASSPQYIYTAQTDNVVSRGAVQASKRVQDSSGTESGSLADQFAPFSANDQYNLFTSNRIKFRVQSNDTSTAGFENTTNIGNNITAMSITVGSNTLTAESITVSGGSSRPIFELNTTGDAADTFWSDNNLDDTQDITITVTLTF